MAAERTTNQHNGQVTTETVEVPPDTSGLSESEREYKKEFLNIARAFNDERQLESDLMGSQLSGFAVNPNEAASFGIDNEEPANTTEIDQARASQPWRGKLKRILSRTEAKADETPSKVRVQDWASKPFALSTQLSLDTLYTSPDYYSAFDIAPQTDGGKGVTAMAHAYVERERSRGGSEVDKTVVWAYTHNGLDVRDFLRGVQEKDQSVAQRTRAVIACESQDRIDTLEQSSLYEGMDVKFKLIDPQDAATFGIPPNTGIALLPDTLDKLPAHQVLVGNNSKQVLEVMESAVSDQSRPLVLMEDRTGRARISPKDVVRAHETAEGSDRYDLVPQLLDNLDTPERGLFPLQHTELRTREESTAQFLDSVPPRLRDHGSVFNYAAEVETIVEAITEEIRDDGLVYISGPLRDQSWLAKEALSSSEGPIVSNVIEAASIRNGVAAAQKRLGGDTLAEDFQAIPVTTFEADGGAYSYVLIDRARDATLVESTKTQFQTSTLVPENDPNIIDAIADLEAARQALADAVANKVVQPDLAEKIDAAYTKLKKVYPQAGRDASLSLDLSRECLSAHLYGTALNFARQSEMASSYLSAPLIAEAEAEAGLGHHSEAIDILRNACRLSPRNPSVYESMIRVYDSDELLKNANLNKYVQVSSDYLRFGQNLKTEEIIATLEGISEALQQDWKDHRDDQSLHKTILVQDLRTGEITKRQLRVSEIKQIIAADIADANAAVAGTLRHYEHSLNERILGAQAKLLNIWNTVVPKDDVGQPLPRDFWKDRSQSRSERWLYTGLLRESDEVIAPPDPSTIGSYVATVQERELQVSAVAEDEPPEIEDMSMTLGKVLNERGHPKKNAFELLKEVLNGHVFITGRTGMGKTTLMETMFEQVPGMGANFWAFDLGDKSELHTVADRLKAKGLPVIVIRPGANEDGEGLSIPVSLDLLRPVEGCSVDEHIGKFVDTWITAFGGGGDSPVGPILSRALRSVYVANGWKVTPIEGEAFPEIGEGEPTVPTLRELLEACVSGASEYAKNTNAANIAVYFTKRFEALEAGGLGNFLVGENALDWSQLTQANVVFDFSHITSHDQRRFLFTALTMQASNYLQFQKGLSKEVDMVWAIDEASLITQDAGDDEYSRKQGVEAFTARLKVLRGYGVSIWNSTQTTQGVHPDFLSQNSVTLALSVKHVRDIHDTLTSLGIEAGSELYNTLATKLTSAERGVALVWRNGMKEPRMIMVDQPTEPSEEELLRARQWQIPPPIRPNPYSKFTIAQHNEAIRKAQSPEQAWKQLLIGSVVLAHVAQIDLPKVPDELKEQWKAETKKPEDAEFARLLVYHMVKQMIHDRIPAIRSVYSPVELQNSVIANVMGLLNNESVAKRVSPAFAVLPIRQSREYKRRVNPTYGLAPSAEQFVGHIEHPQPSPVKTIRKQPKFRGVRRKTEVAAVSDQITDLQRHYASPANAALKKLAENNTERAMTGLVGRTKGGQLWQAIRLVTDGELNLGTQRRLVAAALGYLGTAYSPEESELEEVLTLTYDLHERTQLLAAA